jgi:HEAT repeat protein
MRLCLCIVMLSAGCLLFAGLPGTAADPEPAQGDEQLLRAASLTTDGPALLDFFRKRTQGTVERDKLAALLEQLGDRSGEVREKAAAELVSIGPVVIPPLRQLARDADEPDLAGRARQCLQLLEGNQAAALPIAAARLVAARRPAGAAEVLLAYLPIADDDNVLDEVKAALSAVAVRDGKPEPALLAALDDPSALRRAAAAEALSQVPGEEVRARLRKLLVDPRPMVRLRVALALAGSGKDPKAVSTLIALLAEVPPAQGKQAEDFLLALAAEQAPKVSLGNDDAARQKARDAWAAWWLGTEGPGLLDEFTRRTLTDDVRDKALRLIKQCGDDGFEVREKATTELQAMGAAIAPILRQHASDADLEVSARVRKCLQLIEKDKAVPLSPVIPRLVALRKPAGAAEVMLAYLPEAEDELTVNELAAALAAVAVQDGQPNPALVKALDDRQPLRRGVAAEALWQSGLAEPQAAVRKLLKDPEPGVRVRVALAMAAAREKEAVPVLIALLAEAPPDQAALADDYLRRVAGTQAPAVALGGDDTMRQKCRDAWAAWWKDNAAVVDLAAASNVQRQLGYTMVLYINPSRLIELGTDNKQRWQLDGFQYAYDAQVLPGERVLIAEYSGMRVTERNLKNEVLWEKKVMFNPISAQRLANGNTFIAMNAQFLEVDKTGKEIFTLARPQGDVTAAQKTRDGQIVCVTQQGLCQRLDVTGKELKSFPVGNVTLGGLEVLPNGRILIAQYQNNRVVEYDQEGKAVWEAAVMTPTSATRLPNGNTLVACTNNQQVLELDRTGKTVWEFKTAPQRAWKVRRR